MSAPFIPMSPPLPSPKIHLIPMTEQKVVKGYKTLAHYSHDSKTAMLAVKDKAKRETYRVQIIDSAGPDSAPRFFTGSDSLGRAQLHAYWSVVPPLTPEQFADLI